LKRRSLKAGRSTVMTTGYFLASSAVVTFGFVTLTSILTVRA
jgi:hypothetical protein